MAKKGNSNQRRKSTSTRKPVSKSQTKRVVKTTKTAEAVAEAPVKKPVVEKKEVVLPFGRMNYILLLVCVAVITFGFYLMSLEPFIDAQQFSIALYVAPPIVVAGFLGVIYAIMYKPKPESTS
ncbi:MAG: DUF3098 domain-containing protein [Bacteroidota bacterium]